MAGRVRLCAVLCLLWARVEQPSERGAAQGDPGGALAAGQSCAAAAHRDSGRGGQAGDG